ncbi:MAG: hypothetical protein M5U25_11605 [Planctomycetota bacterium]|nr:hypothetical protein [Planctomycetota bacterium]
MTYISPTPEDAFADLEYLANIEDLRLADRDHLCTQVCKSQHHQALYDWMYATENEASIEELYGPNLMKKLQHHLGACSSCTKHYNQSIRQLEGVEERCISTSKGEEHIVEPWWESIPIPPPDHERVEKRLRGKLY